MCLYIFSRDSGVLLDAICIISTFTCQIYLVHARQDRSSTHPKFTPCRFESTIHDFIVPETPSLTTQPSGTYFKINVLPHYLRGLWWFRYPSKHPKTKTSQVICQNVPFLVSQNVPSIFSLYLIKLEIAYIFVNTLVKTSQVKTSQVKTSQSQNVPKSKHHKLKCPKSKRPKVKMSQVKTSHLICLPVNNITHTGMKFLVYTSNMLYYSDKLMHWQLIFFYPSTT